ncbi:MAG: glycosyltransferase family 2 protein [Anaerolineales bacterium]|nr:glycosyltransferase family 2 protein [Anaerolineales bacterium]
MPKVSVVIPIYNEEATIRLLLDAIYNQTYPRKDIQVVLSDGMSTDSTREVINRFASEKSDMDIIIVDNPKRNIPSALNRAIENAEGDLIVRLDAHSVPYPNYIELCVNDIESGRGDNVGGRWEINPGADTWQAKSIALAAAHRLGVGDARYRVGGEAKIVETVPFGAFRKTLIDKVGWYNEQLLTNEDYEYNVRIAKAGGKVWFNPAICSKYFARATFKDLARQYWRYGYWKGKMVQRYPDTLRWRQILPPVFVSSLVCFFILGWFFPLARLAFTAEAGLYLMILLLAGFQKAFSMKNWKLIIGIPTAISTMHLSWGTSFLWSLLNKNG